MATKSRVNAEFLDGLLYNVEFHATRIASKGDDYVNAAAVLMSVLHVLEGYSRQKPLTNEMINAVCDHTFKALGIEEHRTAMGAVVYSLPKKSKHIAKPPKAKPLGPQLTDGGPGDNRI